MQDFENSQYQRRTTDTNPPSCPCGKEVMDALRKLHEDMRELTQGMGTIRTAFVRNDLGDPDFEGHRQAHLSAIQKDKNLDQLKMAGVLKVVGIVAAAIVAVFVSGMSVHLQKLFGVG